MFREPRFSQISTGGDRPPARGFVPIDQLLAAAACDPSSLDPAQVRATILAEHRKIRSRLARLEAGATALLSCSLPKSHARHALLQRALQLCRELQAHVAFENQVLVPVIEGMDAWGPLRAERLIAEHEQQLQLLRAYADTLTSHDGSAQTLAVAVWQLVETVRQDMHDEEAAVLSPEVFLEQGGESVETG
jgi:iron-sulfur cluster repair protein YtfE (RIC family)